jgi:CBS domain-containing protein
MAVYAKNIMHPRVSIPAKEKGSELVKKMLINYPALPVVNDNLEVIGIVSEHDILSALKEGRTMNEFSAESIMSCGHAKHEDMCGEPVTVTPDTPIEKIIDTMFSEHFTILPVVEKKKLVGLISRKDIIAVLAEKGVWPEAELKQRVKTV